MYATLLTLLGVGLSVAMAAAAVDYADAAYAQGAAVTSATGSLLAAEQYSGMVSAFKANHGRAPASRDELVAAGYLDGAKVAAVTRTTGTDPFAGLTAANATARVGEQAGAVAGGATALAATAAEGRQYATQGFADAAGEGVWHATANGTVYAYRLMTAELCQQYVTAYADTGTVATCTPAADGQTQLAVPLGPAY